MVAVLSVTMASCAGTPRFVYEPRDHALADEAGLVAAQYAIPAESPRGALRLASFGVTEVSMLGRSRPALHVRVILSNGGAETWTVDAREITLALPGRSPTPPGLVNADVRELPVARVPRGGAVAFDLFYPLPRNASARRVPAFEVHWVVRTEAGPVAGATTFDRQTLDDAPPLQLAAGHWHYWWAAPRGERPTARAAVPQPSPR